MTHIKILGLSYPTIQANQHHHCVLSVTYTVIFYVCLINSICFSLVFSLWELLCSYCCHFSNEKYVHHLLNQMPKASTELCCKSDSRWAPPRGTKECHHRNKALTLRQRLHSLSKDPLGHKVTESYTLTCFLSLDFSEPLQNHNGMSELYQLLRAQLDAVDKARHLSQLAPVDDWEIPVLITH